MENVIFNELKIRGYKVDVGVVTISEPNEKFLGQTKKVFILLD
jgi:hypothetical protein